MANDKVNLEKEELFNAEKARVIVDSYPIKIFPRILSRLQTKFETGWIVVPMSDLLEDFEMGYRIYKPSEHRSKFKELLEEQGFTVSLIGGDLCVRV